MSRNKIALVGAGKGIQQLRKPSETGLLEYAESPLKRKLQKYGLFGLKPEGTGTKYTLEARQFGLDQIKATEFAASKSVRELDTAIKELGDQKIDEKNLYSAGRFQIVGSALNICPESIPKDIKKEYEKRVKQLVKESKK